MRVIDLIPIRYGSNCPEGDDGHRVISGDGRYPPVCQPDTSHQEYYFNVSYAESRGLHSLTQGET